MESTVSIWKNCFSEAQNTLTEFIGQPKVWESLEKLTQTLLNTFENEGTVFSCGNGGSHCDAMHLAEEFTGRYRKDRKPMGALALGDPSHVTCVGNDYGFEHIFARQIQGLARKNDCLLLLSTSGNSKNQILAVEAAKSKGLKTVALLGRDGGKLKNLVDLAIVVPAQTSDRIQEIHIKIIHTVIETVERKLFPELYK
ncbi:MAG: D-sedoheptulose 7-phosphate isomerase [Oligoflexia bacterium]|nr:D-sedoheptulose 7-phosphate isomerase [Oligoflexia bacterium]